MIIKGSDLRKNIRQTGTERPISINLLKDFFGGGIYKGLYILGADPGIGKSLFSIQLGIEAVIAGYKVLYISAEMSSDVIGSRLIKMYPDINDDIFDNFYIDDDKRITSDRIITLADELNPDFLIVDYLQFVAQPSTCKTLMDMKDIVKCTLNALLTICAKQHIPVLAISSLVKSSSSISRSISIHDFKDSSCIEYDCDYLLALQYDGVNDGKKIIKKNVDNDKVKRLELVVLKDRHSRLKQCAKLTLDKENCIFFDDEHNIQDFIEEEFECE